MKTKKILKPRKLYEEPAEEIEYIPIEDIEQFIKSRCPVSDRPFKPYTWYNRDGDQLEIWISDESGLAVQEGDLTILRGFSSGKVVGITVHGVKNLLGLKEIPEAGNK